MLSTCMIYQFGRGNLSCRWKGSPGHRLCWHGVKREVNDAKGRKPKAVLPALTPAAPLPAGWWKPHGKAFCKTFLFPEKRHPVSIGLSKLLTKLKGLTDVIRASWDLFRSFWGLS